MTPLPPNPYTLGPIKSRDRLAARSGELKDIEYYLRLAEAGQSPHLALIGQRGVGKTSLLLAVSSLARARHLLPVAIDLTESKVRSAGVFWHDFYSTLILAAVRAGCWGGATGPIYSSLLEQLYHRKVIDLELAVLQFPLVIARHDGDLPSLPCPDFLIVHDFGAVRDELQANGLQGIALLLDEGDCLGAHRSLLQTLRNVLQRVEGICFVIAGTESLFDTVSDVFSPIPRQFHRLDVSRFSEWTETLELVRGPAPETVKPSIATVVELHDVCQGEPAELQLYCHHMYKAVEEKRSERMELTPGVYREVRGAYRAHSQAVDVKVLNAIDELPDALLVKSRWLRRRRLSLEDNVGLERLLIELGDGRTLSADSRRQLHQDMASGYKELHYRGISSSSTSLDLIGGAVTAGYWKSLVQTERTRRWAWVDDGLAPLIRRAVAGALSRELDHGVVRAQVGDNEISATEALEKLRMDLPFKNVSRRDVSRWILACVGARRRDAQTLVDVSYVVEGQRTTRFAVSYVGSDPAELRRLAHAWITTREEVLRAHGMTVTIGEVKESDVPTDREVARLAWVVGISPPGDIFGAGVMGEAVDLFVEGDWDKSRDLFEIMLRDRDDALVRNNLAYCLMAMGRAEAALPHIQKAAAEEKSALREHNLAMAQALNGDLESAKETLRRAWRMENDNPDKDDILCMLLLSQDHKVVRSTEGIPLAAALLTNILTIGAEESSWCMERLAEGCGEQSQRWLEERP